MAALRSANGVYLTPQNFCEALPLKMLTQALDLIGPDNLYCY